MKLVVDSNVLLSGLLWRGAPYRLIEQVRDGKVDIFSSPALLSELAEVLGRPQFADVLERSGSSTEFVLGEVQAMVKLVYPALFPIPVCRDPDDDEVLATALAAQADLIVSGDRDLLVLATFQGIPIVTPSSALERLVPHSM